MRAGMRMLAVAVAVLATALAPTTATASVTPPTPKVGVIDMERIVAEASAARAVIAQRQHYLDVYQKQAAKDERQLSTEDNALAASRPTLAPAEFEKRRKAFQATLAKYQHRIQTRRRNLERAFDETMDKFQAAVIRAASGIAHKRGMTFVLYRSQVFLFAPNMDITAAVLTKVNATLPTLSMPNPDTLPTESPAANQPDELPLPHTGAPDGGMPGGH